MLIIQPKYNEDTDEDVPSIDRLRELCAAGFSKSARPIPDDVQAVSHSVLDHRLILEPRARLAGSSAELVLDAVLARVDVPVLPGADPPPGG